MITRFVLGHDSRAHPLHPRFYIEVWEGGCFNLLFLTHPPSYWFSRRSRPAQACCSGLLDTLGAVRGNACLSPVTEACRAPLSFRRKSRSRCSPPRKPKPKDGP